MPALGTVVVGIDVGGPRKGFHAVSLCNGQYLDQTESPNPEDIVKWCLDHGAVTVAVDAPCQWSLSGRARVAERALMAEKIWCFSTPSQAIAQPKSFYKWMLHGARLYRLLTPHFSLYSGTESMNQKTCFETFPHAVACALAGKKLSAKNKRTERPQLLTDNGIATARLSSIDYVDAALCALVAHRFTSRSFRCYGDAAEGFILVPSPATP